MEYTWKLFKDAEGKITPNMNLPILSLFNMASVTIGVKVDVNIPNKYQEMFEGMNSFDANDNTIFNGRYVLTFIESDDDFIEIGESKIIIE